MPAAHPSPTPPPPGPPPVVTRLVSVGLALVAVAVVLSATTGGIDPRRSAQTAAETGAAVPVVAGQPGVVRVVGAQRLADAIVLRVDPAGDLSARSLILSPAARVDVPAVTGGAPSRGAALVRLLEAAASPAGLAALRQQPLAVSYDESGHVTGLAALD